VWLKIIPAKYGAHFAEGLFQQTPEQLLPDRNYFNKMIPVSKGQKAVRACTIRLLSLGHAKYEKVAIYAVNQRISNIWRIAGAA
jgi:hypothetical protein